MRASRWFAGWTLTLIVLVGAGVAGAQAFPSSGAISLYADWSNRTDKDTDEDSDFSEIIAMFSWYSEMLCSSSAIRACFSSRVEEKSL